MKLQRLAILQVLEKQVLLGVNPCHVFASGNSTTREPLLQQCEASYELMDVIVMEELELF